MEYLEPAVMIVLGLMILIAAAAWGVVLLVLRRTALRDWAAIEIWLTVTIFVLMGIGSLIQLWDS